MLDGNINVKDSTVKTKIDEWYQTNMTGYTSQLEDTVFCNDRTYYNFDTSGWNKDYSNIEKDLYFGSYQRTKNNSPSLVCPRQIDSFTVNISNGNGNLTYPVGMITADEIVYVGVPLFATNTSCYLYNGVDNLSISPGDIGSWTSFSFSLTRSGQFSIGGGLNSLFGVRPVVSLKQGIAISGGIGTAESPFVIS